MTVTALIPATLPGFDISTVGARWADLDDVDPDATLAACARLRTVGDTSRWLLGDLAAALMATVGEAEAIRRLANQGHNQAEFDKALSLALAVPHSIRRPTLTWSHHVEVAKMDRPAQAHWLERAETEAWSVRDLRKAIHDDHHSRRPQLPGTERLPRPPETLLRAALEQHPTDPVIWSPTGGALASGQVRDVKVRGDRAIVVLEVDASLAAALAVDDERGAA